MLKILNFWNTQIFASRWSNKFVESENHSAYTLYRKPPCFSYRGILHQMTSYAVASVAVHVNTFYHLPCREEIQVFPSCISSTEFFWVLRQSSATSLFSEKPEGGSKKHFADFLIFHPIFHRFTLNFANTPSQVPKAWNIVYKNMKTQNPSRCSLASRIK